MKIARLIVIVTLCLFLTGTLLDILTTKVALSHPNAYEGNSFLRDLMNRGLWETFEILIGIIVIVPQIILMKYTEKDIVQIILTLFVLVNIIKGVDRMQGGIHNLGVDRR